MELNGIQYAWEMSFAGPILEARAPDQVDELLEHETGSVNIHFGTDVTSGLAGSIQGVLLSGENVDQSEYGLVTNRLRLERSKVGHGLHCQSCNISMPTSLVITSWTS